MHFMQFCFFCFKAPKGLNLFFPTSPSVLSFVFSSLLLLLPVLHHHSLFVSIYLIFSHVWGLVMPLVLMHSLFFSEGLVVRAKLNARECSTQSWAYSSVSQQPSTQLRYWLSNGTDQCSLFAIISWLHLASTAPANPCNTSAAPCHATLPVWMLFHVKWVNYKLYIRFVIFFSTMSYFVMHEGE